MLRLKFENYFKHYKKGNISIPKLEITNGEIFGIFKTSDNFTEKIIEILINIRKREDGKFFYHNILCSHKKEISLIEKVGYLPKKPLVYDELKVIDYLKLQASYNKLSNKNLTLYLNKFNNLFYIPKISNTKIKNLNIETKVMINYLTLLFSYPTLIIWDEPFTYFSSDRVKKIIDFTKELISDGVCVCLCSNKFKQLTDFCENICFIEGGTLSDKMNITKAYSFYKEKIEDNEDDRNYF